MLRFKTNGVWTSLVVNTFFLTGSYTIPEALSHGTFIMLLFWWYCQTIAQTNETLDGQASLFP
jgi:hypothetical protein